MPGPRTLLSDSSLGLKLQGRVRGALVSPLLSIDQVFGCTLLEQASSLKTHGACVGMSPEVLNHGMTSGIPDASWIWESNLPRDFRAGTGAIVEDGVNRHSFVGYLAVPRTLPWPVS